MVIKKLLIIASLLMVLLASCSKTAPQTEPSQEEPSEPVGEFIYSVTVALEDSTKATLGEPENNVRKVTWNTGDKICVNGSASDALSSEYNGKETAVFTFNEHPIPEGAPYIACYPASVYKNATHVTLPATQGDAQGENKSLAFPMVGKAATAEDLHNISLKQLCGFIRLKVQGKFTLSSMSFTGNNNEQVSGDFTLGWTDGVPTLTPKETPTDADKTVSTSSSAVLTRDTDKYCIIAVPANTYSAGTKLSFTSANDNTIEVNSSSSKTITRAAVKNISTLTLNMVEISTADEYIAFANDFKDGAYGNSNASLVVHVTADLDFTGKTFVTIDNGTYKFGGTWYGNGYAMKNITSENVPMFYTPTGSFYDIVIDETCSFKKTTAFTGHWGILVRTIDTKTSVMSGCKINCDWTVDYGNTGEFCYGTLVGRSAGTVKDCEMNGNFVCNCGYSDQLTKPYWIGGMVGFNNAGTIQRCTNNGNVTFNEPTNKPVCGTKEQYFHIGGVLGRNTGKAEYLTMNGDVSYKDYTLDAFVGGVIGNTDGNGSIADHITMKGNIEVLQPDATKADGYARLFAGGVIGRAWAGTVSNCTNISGKKLTGSSQTNNMNLGGVIGSVGGTTAIQNCTNNMTVEMIGSVESGTVKAPYYAYIGGIAGSDQGGTILNIENNGPVNVGIIGNTSGSQTHVGGIIGYCNIALDGGTITNNKSSIHNNAQIYTNALRACTGFAGANFGGVIGRMDQNAKNLTNSGKVYLNFGDQTEDKTSILKYVSGGGVIGRVAKAVTVDGCVNTALVQFRCFTSLTTAANAQKQVNYIGGVVGCAMGGANSGALGGVTIKNCTSYGNINSSNNNTIYPSYNATSGILQGKEEGGVIGVIIGTDAARATVENCQSASSTAHNAPYGYFGCVVGMAVYTDIKGCSNTTNVTGSAGNGCTIGGILGITNAKITIRDCTVDFTLTNFNVAGGIVAACNTASPNHATIEGNKATIVATTTSASKVFGAIARNPVAATVVQNNGIKGSLNGTAFSDSYAPYCGTTTYTCDSTQPNYVF